MGRASKNQAVANRSAVVSAAAGLFREKGDSVGIDDLMAAAGLTRGGFYKMFSSKEQLAAEAYGRAFEGSERAWRSCMVHGELDLKLLAEYYLSPKPLAQECPLVTNSGDIARVLPDSFSRKAFTEGFLNLDAFLGQEAKRPSQLAALAMLVGAQTLARALNDDGAVQSLVSAVKAEISKIAKSQAA